MELLIGCGNSRRKKLIANGVSDWTNLVTIDHDPNCGADIVHDLDDTPWPLDDDTFDECHAYEVLEHLGQQGDFKAFFRHFGEIWRVLKDGGLLVATCPAWDSPWAWGDPSHTRIISKQSLAFLDPTEYARQVGATAMTDFRWLWDGDFEPLGGGIQDGSFRFVLRAHKPGRHVTGGTLTAELEGDDGN
jgi:SAM-dependent methyltransferase